jgi:ribose transport system ATP-binding protein
MTDEFLLEAAGVAKNYGAVTALRDASLAVRPGEVHALMGANGAGMSTLVKILTGAIRPDAGSFQVLGQSRRGFSPAESRRIGIASVYQEPSLIPDLDVRSNLALTATPVEPFRAWMAELGVPDLELSELVHDIPLPILRVIDLARALAVEPALLLLDEMTAALPADLTERVMDVVARQRAAGRSVIFISHRLVEIRALCDRATVLRDGRTVGVLDVTEGADDRIVELMLGQVAREPAPAEAIPGAAASQPAADRPVRLAVRSLQAGTKLSDVSFDLHPGEVLGVVALEGQGQDELFEVLSGSRRPSAGEIAVDGRPMSFRDPSDAIGAGLLYVPANRAEALLMQRSVRENIALPSVAPVRRWGPIRMKAERARVKLGVDRLQIDTRAASEVRRLSGGNQQKVTIARWIAAGVETLLCFDPTRGIDIRTKRDIYHLLRELAAGGAAVLLYTSELEEIQLACDRAIVIFGGRVVDELPASEADEAALLRAAHGLEPAFAAGHIAAGAGGTSGQGPVGGSPA